VSGADTRPVIGVLGGGGEAYPAVTGLRLAVGGLELGRRLAGHEIRLLCLDPVPAADGDVVEAVRPWSGERAAELGGDLDLLVVLPGADGPEARALAASGLPVVQADPGLEPLALASRAVPPAEALSRARYLRLSGRVPPGPSYHLSLGTTGSGAVEPSPEVSVSDLAGLVAGAASVGATARWAVALAASYGRPVEAGAGGAGDSELEADRAFDDICRGVVAAAPARRDRGPEERLRALQKRVSLVEAAHSGLSAALGRERRVLAEELSRALSGDSQERDGPWTASVVRRQARELEEARSEVERLTAELDRVYATRVMRAAAPARRVYGRLRRPR
jgi:hypothetical protein